MDPINVTADATTFTCNAYLVPGEKPALIDAGSMTGVVDVIRDYVRDLDRVVLTHQHSDHVEELEAVLDAFDAELYAYEKHPQRDVELKDGDAVTLGDWTFETVYTPGHAADHVSLVAEAGLFSGDVVVHNDGAFDNGSFGRTDLPGQSRERLIESLETLRGRLPGGVKAMYAGHGDVFRATEESVKDVIERALERAKRRKPKYPDE